MRRISKKCSACSGTMPIVESSVCDKCLRLKNEREAILGGGFSELTIPEPYRYFFKRLKSEDKKKSIVRLLKKQAMHFNKDRDNTIRNLLRMIPHKTARKRLKLETKVRRTKKQGRPLDGFYETREWQQLRFKTIIHYGRKCMCCGIQNVELHVDHIKPRSKYPELELDFNNLQILCRNCNFGKSNLYETDFRPREQIPQKNVLEYIK